MERAGSDATEVDVALEAARSVIGMELADGGVCARVASVAGGGCGGGKGVGGSACEPTRVCSASSRGFQRSKTEGSCRSGGGALGLCGTEEAGLGVVARAEHVARSPAP